MQLYFMMKPVHLGLIWYQLILLLFAYLGLEIDFKL